MRVGALGVLGCFLAQLSCQPAEPAPRSVPLEVLFTGCSPEGKQCAWSDGPITLWINGARSATDLELRLDGTRVEPTPTPQSAGFRWSIEPAGADSWIELRLRGATEKSFSLQLTAAVPPAPALRQASALRRGGDLDGAAELLREATRSTPAPRQRRLLSALARIERARGQADEARQLLSRARALHQDANAFADYVNDTTLLVYIARETNTQLKEASIALQSLTSLPIERHADSRYLIAYYRGLLSSYFGETRGALEALDDAIRVAERMGWNVRREIAEELDAALHQALGDHESAVRRFSRAVASAPADLDSCSKAQQLVSYGWSILVAREARQPVALSALAENGDADAVLRQATIAAEACTDYPNLVANLKASRALAALQRGDLASATVLLETLETSETLSVDVARWRRDLQARLASAEGRFEDALHLYKVARREATSTEEVWRAEVGLARAESALGRPRRAHAAYARALSVERSEGLAMPFDYTRGLFMAEREVAASEYVNSLLSEGLETAALDVVRSRQSLTLRDLVYFHKTDALGPEEREQRISALERYRRERKILETAVDGLKSTPLSERSAEELRVAALRTSVARARDDMLAFSTLDAEPSTIETGHSTVELFVAPGGSAWMAADGSVTYHPAFSEGAELPRRSALALKKRSEGAAVLRVHIEGDGLEIHRLLDDENTPPVVYGFDLPPAEPRALPSTALVVIDPLEDLPQAREEGKEVAGRLKELGLSVRVLSGAAATREAVLAALGTADVFHYAGHGRFKERDEWSSALPLNGGSLSVGDIVSLRVAPELVVLSGCETARSGARLPNLGVAQGFVVAGARYVLAATRSIPDALSRRVTRAFWDASSSLDVAQTPTRWKHASVRLRQTEPNGEWAAFRLMTR
ncbi:MAG: CHAT domain-containing protein [Myxococcota bacterium]